MTNPSIYQEAILDHYHDPRNKGKLENHTHKAHKRNPVCGDELTLFLKIENNTISDIAFDGTGCAISQASVSMLTEKLKGMPIEEVQKLDAEYIIDMLGIVLTPTRIKCAVLGLQTAQKALKEENA